MTAGLPAVHSVDRPWRPAPRGHGDRVTPFFEVVDGRRVLALPVSTLQRPLTGQMVDVFHELNHARHNYFLGYNNYNSLYATQRARIEILVQDRAIRQVQRYYGPISDRILQTELGHITDWLQEQGK